MVQLVASQSKATVPSFQKKKVAAPDASVASSGTIPISALIENVDMEDLIKVYLSDGPQARSYLHLHL